MATETNSLNHDLSSIINGSNSNNHKTTMKPETTLEHFLGAFPDIILHIIDSRGLPPANIDLWVSDRLSIEEDTDILGFRFAGDWHEEWRGYYEGRLKFMARLRATCRWFHNSVNPFFLRELWFTHPTQMRAFLKVFSAGHPLLETATTLRVDVPLAPNISYNWPYHRTNDMFYLAPLDTRTALYGYIEFNNLYYQLVNRLQHIKSFDNGIHESFSLCAHPPPPQYIRLLVANTMTKLTSLKITSPVYHEALTLAISHLQHLEDLVIHFLEERVPNTRRSSPLKFRCLRRFCVGGHFGVQPLKILSTWELPLLEVFSCDPISSRDSFLYEALKNFGLGLRQLMIRGKYSLPGELCNELPLRELCPRLESLELMFTQFTPLLLRHPTIHTISFHWTDLLHIGSPEMANFQLQVDTLIARRSEWPRLVSIRDTCWPARPFNHSPQGYMAWWGSEQRLERVWREGIAVRNIYGGDMKGDLDWERAQGFLEEPMFLEPWRDFYQLE
ncbi:hypothetical protein M422DRAFT_55730 [Sphaerobolus stellatus SS14]|uniref:Uncharacterized protein n=1 Tax=Sphaerobolus stellatus (strain SS14) TaxID=990650 RepID=A0A0C9TVX8_SPHS4|nr:hypothetical protein M422DRAFT_55730 [Sphaerobolus stellatus SS14]